MKVLNDLVGIRIRETGLLKGVMDSRTSYNSDSMQEQSELERPMVSYSHKISPIVFV